MEGRIARDQNVAENAMLQIDKIGGNIVKNAKKAFGDKADDVTRKKLDKEINNFFVSDKFLTPNIKETIDTATGEKNIFLIQEELPKQILKLVYLLDLVLDNLKI